MTPKMRAALEALRDVMKREDIDIDVGMNGMIEIWILGIDETLENESFIPSVDCSTITERLDGGK